MARAAVIDDTAGASRTARTEPVRDDVRRVRKRKGGTSIDKFAIPPEMQAFFDSQGLTVEWKRETTIGANDPSYDVLMREQGWLPVDGEQFPDYVAPGHKGAIRRDGMVLMERPKELTEEAKAEELASARNAVAIKEQQLHGAPDGQFQRHRADGSPTVNVQRTVERGGLEIE